MPVNPYFNFTTFTTEQNLTEDLIIEAIQIYGHSVYYIPRDTVNIDDLFGEDSPAKYSSAHEVEVYLKSNIQFQGASETLSKFGLVISDDATFVVAVKRWVQAVGTPASLIRPRENDLIFIELQAPEVGGLTKRMIFEIRFVEDKEQLFQLGKLYTYELQCELMNYSNERVQTGNAAIDNVATSQAYTQDIQFATGNGVYQVGEVVFQGPSFVSAEASATVSGWNANTLVLSVVSITGEFNGSDLVTGVTSNAVYSPSEAPVTLPVPVHDGISDNQLLDREQPDIIVPSDNPRFS
jgi:hypothetical protein